MAPLDVATLTVQRELPKYNYNMLIIIFSSVVTISVGCARIPGDCIAIEQEDISRKHYYIRGKNLSKEIMTSN